ncbi:S9 family peptidase [Salinirussus salinus]|uniref:S9 family peptidase n=1 Tax=Salinirussus salinus TaxID=1198300 RepID=UPI00135B5A2B|nr:S9 family peptidase [Salinirussus salinus]
MERIEATDFHDLAGVTEPRVAPGGERVAFVRAEPSEEGDSYEATVHLAPTGGGQPRRFTLAEGVDSQPRFSPGGDRLAFVSTRGADDDRPQLWVVPTDGGEARQVTDVVGGVEGIAWGPAGDRVAFVQRVTADDREADRDLSVPDDYEPEPPDPRVIDRTVYRSMEEYFDGRRGQVYLAHLGGAPEDAPGPTGGEGDEIERVTDADRDHATPEFGDADTLYYTVRDGEPDPDDSNEHTIVAYDTASGEREALHTTTAWATTLAATGDGRVAYTYVEDDRASMRPVEARVYEVEAGEVHTPMAALDRTLSFDHSVQWGPDDESLYLVTPDEGAGAVWAAPWDGDGSDAERVVREAWASVDGLHVGEDLLAVVRSEWDHPGDLYVTTPGGTEERRLTRANADLLDDRAVSRPEEVSVSVDAADWGESSHEVQGWVLTPPDFDPDETYPLAVEVHGGPHAMWTTSGTMWHEFQTLAARGYVVFWSNPRGSTGYGQDFAEAIERDWGAVTAADVLAGVDEVTDRAYVDGDQVFLTGGSFGGFMTAWLVGHTDRFTAAVSQRGVYDLTGFYGSTDMAYKLVEGDFDAVPWEDADFLWEQSPVSSADAVETPTLVLHSEDDYRTPASTAELFYRALRKHGIDTRLVRYPDEGHELSRSGQPNHIVDRVERIARWFDGYSEYHDTPRALDREDEAGLSAGEEDGGDGDGAGTGDGEEGATD